MNGTQTLIRLEDVTKTFPRHAGSKLLKDHLRGFFRPDPRDQFHALKHVSLTVERGESLAIVGRNGAGKSTLLGVMAGLAQQDSGTVTIDGRITALLSLGLGFQPDLSGRENIALNASLLGLTRAETTASTASIVEFAEIPDFIDEPLRTYSTGMVLRLAFAVAVHVHPDVILVDEVMAVGDASFQAKCLDRIRELKRTGSALVVVSHSAVMLREFCEKAVWLDQGEVMMSGDTGPVLEAYSAPAPVPAA